MNEQKLFTATVNGNMRIGQLDHDGNFHYAIMGNREVWWNSQHADSLTDLTPVKVVDMDDIVLKLMKKEINAAKQMLVKGCAPSPAIDSICLKIVTAAYPPTPAEPACRCHHLTKGR